MSLYLRERRGKVTVLRLHETGGLRIKPWKTKHAVDSLAQYRYAEKRKIRRTIDYQVLRKEI
jgi:hypothetical protein